MNRLREKMIRFMQGRYGVDDLTRFLMSLMVVCMILSVILRSSILNTFVWILIFYMYFRMFSRNFAARYAENQKFLSLKNRLFSGMKGNQSRKDPYNKIYKCPGCGQKVRVPKGRGKIEIRCPKCSCSFMKRT